MAALTPAQKRHMDSYPGGYIPDTTHPSVVALKGHLVTAIGNDGRDNLDIAASNRTAV